MVVSEDVADAGAELSLDAPFRPEAAKLFGAPEPLAMCYNLDRVQSALDAR